MTPKGLELPTITVGADPEFFIRRNGHFLSAHNYKCGTKKEPMKTKHGFIQVDGLALECNVLPASTRDEFIRNVSGAMGDLQEYVSTQDKATKIVAAPSVLFGKHRLAAMPREAVKLGCEKDWNAYTGKPNPRPDENSVYRTASGHIHIGWTKVSNPNNLVHNARCGSLARQLDYYLGLPSLSWDPDPIRRRLYGQAGAYRAKPYGIEYRVLSNRWTISGALAGYVFDQTVKAFKSWWEGKSLDHEYHGAAQEIINQGKVNWRETYPKLAEIVL
jgi:hypothetical protein